MNLQIVKRLLAMALIATIALSFGGCCFWGPCEPEEPARLYIWFVDQSISVSPARQREWEAITEEHIKCLKCGDKVLTYGMHDQSLNAAPIYNESIPAFSDPPTHDEEEECHQKLNQVRRELREKLHEAFSPQRRSSTTDIFSAIDRIKTDKVRQTIVYFVGDMIQSNQELDLEHMHLKEQNIVALLNPIVAKHGWQPGRLKGVKIHCILNSIGIREAAPLNDRRILRKFWETLFVGLGGTLETFDTHISIN
jgi:hypothetical protein